MDMGEKIKSLRSSVLELSQEAFAKKINVSRKTISNWENGTSKPSTQSLMVIALLCNVTTDYLIYDEHPFELSSIGLNDEEYNLLKEFIIYLEKINKDKKIREKQNL